MKISDFINSLNNSPFEDTAIINFQAFKNENQNKPSDSQLYENEEYSNRYVRFNEEKKPSKLPKLSTILVGFMLLSAFIILPIVYLINCFRFSFDNQQFHHHDRAIAFPHSSINSNIKPISEPNKLPQPPKPDYGVCKSMTDVNKFDCYPGGAVDQQKCEERGCCWLPRSDGVPLNVPYCFYPSNYGGYSVVNVTGTSFGLTAFLKREYSTGYPGDVGVIKMVVKYESETRLRVKIVDPLSNRYECPYPEIPIVDKASINLMYRFEIDTFHRGFKVKRKSDDTIIFDSNDFTDFIYSDQLLQISTKLPSGNIFGIGEHRSGLRVSTNWTRFTLFNHDEIPTNQKNLYGSHPFYLAMENTGNSHGVFLLNSNAMDILLQPTPAITFRTIGGILDFYFFLGPTPAEVIAQYTEVIGRPLMPPYWSLGFHLCRFGYKTLNNTKMVMQRNINAGIPLDTQWNDLDYMDNNNDFTYDPVNYQHLPEFVEELHSNGMHYVVLIDPGVSASETPGSYPPYDVGIKMDVFVKDHNGKPFVGKVWNKKSTVWPDFTDPTTVDYWTEMLKSLHRQMEFDGAWIDMNEPSNFLSGSFDGCPDSRWERPPYDPDVDGGILNYKTLCMSARHYAGSHYDVHNLYGLSEAIVTSFAMAEIRGKRPMVISRSSFSGLGRYAGHWSGDVWSSWDDMGFTIPSLLSFSLYGVPLMGADICGFNGNTTSSLCNRWMQLGAFYPFSRNHNTDDGNDQDPVAMGKQVVESSIKALTIRYKLLPYLYTLFHKAHVNGDTVARPLFFEYPKDLNTYNIDDQFLWGPALMIAPVLKENDTSVTTYVPQGTWYNYYTFQGFYSNGQNYTLDAPLDTIPLLIKGGHVLPMQSPGNTTRTSRLSFVELLVASDDSNYAIGQLYWDDGDSLNSFEEQQYSLITFELNGNTLRSKGEFIGTEIPPDLSTVTILGVAKAPMNVQINGLSLKDFEFVKSKKSLTINNMSVQLRRPFVLEWK
ncbi:unnamed protein product [Phyllotreta striolata]|uniref:P-type domain-containing protein n=1 Tax=Phyllotreta striolata TaxID=444603 RepID=A0A9N9TPQ8_PHYSR|nr:unnamed protein product [Phyllotreta striolata]